MRKVIRIQAVGNGDELPLPPGVRGEWRPRLQFWPEYDGDDRDQFSLHRDTDLEDATIEEWGAVVGATFETWSAETGLSVYTLRPHRPLLFGLFGAGRIRWDLAYSHDYYSLSSDAINVRQLVGHEEIVHLLAGPLAPQVLEAIRRQPCLDRATLLPLGAAIVVLALEQAMAAVAFASPEQEPRFLEHLGHHGGRFGYGMEARVTVP
jgi:hypothetical protein